MKDERPADFVRFVNKSHHWRDALRVHGSESGMNTSALAVVMMLEFHANADGSNAYPGETVLAERLGTSVSTVNRGMRLARKLGWVFCTRAGNFRVGNASVWRVCIPSHVPVGDGEAKAGVLPSIHVSEGRQSNRRPEKRNAAHDASETSGGRVVDTRPIAEQRREYEQVQREEGYYGD